MNYTPLRRYYRGDELIAMRDVPAGVTRYYHFDHQGTTQALTDSTGAVTDRFASDAWGVEVKRTGNSINRQWYVGNWGYSRGQNGRYYIRARHYPTSIGAFLSRDVESEHDPYSYTRNWPTRLIDPSGMVGWEFGEFRYAPPLFDPDTDYRKQRLKPEDTIRCLSTVAFLRGFSPQPLLDKFVNRWVSKRGGVYTLLPAEMQKVIRVGSAYTQACHAYVMGAVRFAESKLQCPSRDKKIWHSGWTLGAIVDTEDFDYGWALGAGRAWASGVVSCECNYYTLEFTFRITDQALGDKPNRGYPNPYPCHKVGWSRDFIVKGEWSKSFAWWKGRFAETAADIGTCP